jgi:hypothetical protein
MRNTLGLKGFEGRGIKRVHPACHEQDKKELNERVYEIDRVIISNQSGDTDSNHNTAEKMTRISTNGVMNDTSPE